jgi:hypothetical protein
MLSFLNEEYGKVIVPFGGGSSVQKFTVLLQSEQELTLAFYNCHLEAHSNQECVLHVGFILLSLTHLCSFQTDTGIPHTPSHS